MIKKKQRQRIFLKEWRKHRGITQEGLADRIGIDRTIVSKIENGKLDYHQSFLEAAAYALMCEPADLLVRDPTAPDAIWTIWERIPPAERPKAQAVLQALTNTSKKSA
jgi:transcriptional regulator with XRE-family HTH domain